MKRRNLCLAVIIAVSMLVVLFSSHVFASTFSLTVSTNQPIYSPGSSVLISGSLANGGAPVPSAPVSVVVQKPSGAMIFVDMPTTGSNGRFSTAFALPPSADLGQYTVTAAYQDGNTQTSFTVAQVTTTSSSTTSSSITTSSPPPPPPPPVTTTQVTTSSSATASSSSSAATSSTSTSSTLSTGTTTSTSSSNTSSTLSTSTDATTTTINTPEFGDWSIIALSLLLVVTTSQIHRQRGSANGSPTCAEHNEVSND
jgi:hypothetical protein